MRLHGVIRTAELRESHSDEVEMLVRVQGVAPDQPRLLVIPFSLLINDPTLDADTIVGRGFEADVEQDADGRWVVAQIALARRILRLGPEG